MQNKLSSILRRATREDGKPLNIITYVTHERYEPYLCKTGHDFWAMQGGETRKWNTRCAPIPPNYHILQGEPDIRLLPPWVDFDLILVQNIQAHMPSAFKIAQQLNIPILNLWHVLPHPNTPKTFFTKNIPEIAQISKQIFISDFNKAAWGFGNTDASVVTHCVDSDFWKPADDMVRENVVLSICNDWINRDVFCGFNLWANVVNFRQQTQLPVRVYGNTPGLSQDTNSIEEALRAYQGASIFLNTSLASPIPCVVLEAMSCGCAVVSTNTCMIPEIIQNGYNGLLCSPNDPNNMRQMITNLLNNPALARELGNNARKTIQEKFKVSDFVDKWNRIFYNA